MAYRVSKEVQESIKSAIDILSASKDKLPKDSKVCESLNGILSSNKLTKESIAEVVKSLEEASTSIPDKKAEIDKTIQAMKDMKDEEDMGSEEYKKKMMKLEAEKRKMEMEMASPGDPKFKNRKKLYASASLIESVSGTEGKEWEMILIQSGLSKNRFMYPDETLVAATHLFEGVKAYVDHPSSSERKDLPERSIREIAGWYTNARKEPDGIHAKFHVSAAQPWLREMMVDAYENGKLDLIGVSIFAEGKTRVEKKDGKFIWMVETIDRVGSVDVVTSPAAGGRIAGLIESEGGELDMLENVSLEELEKARPDLLEAIKKKVAPVEPVHDTKLEEQFKEMQRTFKLVQCSNMLKESVDKSGLPIPMKESIMHDFNSMEFEQKDLDTRVARDKEVLAQLIKSPELPFTPRVSNMVSEGDKYVKALDGMIQNKKIGDIKPFRSLTEAYALFKGISPIDINPVTILGESRGYDSGQRTLLVESITTATWAEILGDSITRALLNEYQLPALEDWRKLVSNIVSVKDFRTQRRQRYGGYGTLPAVAEGGTYQNLTSPGDEEATYAPSKRGGLEDLTIETIANDDLGAVQRIPQRLSRAAKITLYRFVFDFLNSNSNIYDATALFTTGHGNLGSTALSMAEFVVARRAMRDQTAYGNSVEFLQIKPKLLIVPNELEATAERVRIAEFNPDPIQYSASGGTANISSSMPNVVRNTFEVIVVDYWTDSDNWYLVADPNYIPTIELGFLNGKQEPELLTQNDPTVGSVFTADKISYKIRHIYGGAVLDFRGFYGEVVG